MEQKTNELLEQAIQIMGEDADIMIVTHKNGQCGAVIHGNVDNCAQAVFACMHQSDDQVGNAMYRIVKLNAMNLFTNPTPYGQDLADSIGEAIDELSKEMEDVPYEELN